MSSARRWGPAGPQRGGQKWLRRIQGVLDCNGGDWQVRGSGQVEHADGYPERAFWSFAPHQQAGVGRLATYPVDGPLQVLGTAKGAVRGGVLHDDLKEACVQALAVPRHEARAQALTFSWSESAAQFLAHLVPTDVSGASGKVSVTRLS